MPKRAASRSRAVNALQRVSAYQTPNSFGGRGRAQNVTPHLYRFAYQLLRDLEIRDRLVFALNTFKGNRIDTGRHA